MFTIIGRRFTPEQFAAYVAGIKLSLFQPSFVVIHNTATPNLSQRPNGFTPASIESLHDFYQNVQKWLGGPHCFVDDKEDGIVVFNPIDRRGTHSPSWNGIAWGIEMLGDYAIDDFTTGRGAKVAQNAIKAAAVLLDKIGASASNTTIRLHKEDPKTTHDCPGRHVIKADFVSMVRTVQNHAAAPAPEIHSEYRLLLNNTDLGATWQNPADGGRNYGALRLLLNKLYGADVVSRKLVATTTGATWDGTVIPAPIVLHESGAKFVQLAAFATWQGLSLERDITVRTVTLRKGL